MEDPNLNWRKSSYSSNGGGECVETADGAGAVMVRDTANRAGVTLTLTANVWSAFTSELK